MGGRPIDIGSLFSAILVKKNPDVDFMMFSDDAKYLSLNTEDSVVTISETIKRKSKMAGTNFNSIFNRADKAYDRIVILSDMECWMATPSDFFGHGGSPDKTFMEYKKKFDTKPKVFSFDLNGYGTLAFPQKDVYALAGFSDKVFDIMKFLESDKEALLNEVNKIEL